MSTHLGTPLPKAPQEVESVDVTLLLKKVIEEDNYKGFELIFKQYYKTLCNYALRYVSSKEAACDVVSEVFYRLWKNRASIDIEISLKAYLFSAVKNQAYNYLSREFKKDVSMEQQYESCSMENYNPEQSLLYNELNEKIESAIDSLTPQCKTVFRLSRYEGLKYNEIAVRLNISPKAVEAQISRALRLIRPLVRAMFVVISLLNL